MTENWKWEEYRDFIVETYFIEDVQLNALGLCAEAGEFANKIKKRTYQEVSDEEIIEELGDTLWHLTQLAKIFNVTLEDLMLISAEKTIRKNIFKKKL